MSSSAPDLELSAVVGRLRTAGCVFAEAEARLLLAAPGSAADLARRIEQRAAGLPLEHVLGWAEFCGLRIAVDAGVFVPRRRTELLATTAIETARARLATAPQRPVVLDLCCGSGAIAAAVVAAVPEADVHATDIDPAAVRCARRNLPHAVDHVYEGDLYAPLPPELHGHVDVLVANAPYVPTDEIAMMPPEARVHEAPVALDGGADGLDVLRRVIAAAPLWLAPQACLLVESSDRQTEPLVAALRRNGLVPQVRSSAALAGTVVIGTRADAEH